MKIEVNRKYKKEEYTIGQMFIDGVFFCNTLEDKDRGLTQEMSTPEILEYKVYAKTAIPTGTYEVTIDTVSPKFSKYPFYMEVCKGKLPRLKEVKGYSGVLIHVMDGPKGAALSLGCIGVGDNKIKGGLINGKQRFTDLYNKMKTAVNKGEPIQLTIK